MENVFTTSGSPNFSFNHEEQSNLGYPNIGYSQNCQIFIDQAQQLIAISSASMDMDYQFHYSPESDHRLVETELNNHKLRSKAARLYRMAERQRKIESRNSFIMSSSSQIYMGESTMNGAAANRDDLYTFTTPDNKKLMVLLKKVLKKSDINGQPGRIVLPKRDAEAYLPILIDRESIDVVIKDVYSTQEWTMKYKFWANCKSRMYLFEDTWDFINQNGLEAGDSLVLYKDESTKIYYSIEKVEKPMPEPLDSLFVVPNDRYISSPLLYEETCVETFPLHGKVMWKEDDDTNSDDCFANLGSLPEINKYMWFG